MQELKFKDLILNQMLEISPWSGWNEKNLKLACKRLGLDNNYYLIIFPKAVDDVLLYYNQLINKDMVDRLTSVDFSSMKIRDRIYLSIEIVLRQNFKNKLAIKKMISYYVAHGKTVLGLRSLYNTISNIWYSIGDKSTDFNFYTKRATLILIYMKIIIFWVNDHSKDDIETLKYLKKQIDSALSHSPIKIFKKIFDVNNLPFIRLIDR